MTKWQESQALYDAIGIVISKLAEQENRRLSRVRYRLDQRMYELNPTTSPTPYTQYKMELNEMVHGKEEVAGGIILCHKCGGLLAHAESDNVTGLLDCQCMSSYVRGFELSLSRSEAIAAQIKHQDMWIGLYTQQGRSKEEIAKIEEKKAALALLK